MAALGYMAELLRGSASWWSPTLLGNPPENPSLLPYWLGVWAMQLAPVWVAPEFAARVPYIALLTLTLLATWYGTYYLGRSPKAQPVAFAFGGEARPSDYARAMADGSLLALIASLGLAQLSHETTPALAQLGCAALFYYGVSALPYHRNLASGSIALGLVGLSLCGAPAIAVLWGAGTAVLHSLDKVREAQTLQTGSRSTTDKPPPPWFETTVLLLATLASALAAWLTHLWRWKVQLPAMQWSEWNGYLQLLIWFTWPSWPLALWTVWRWRHQLFRKDTSRHLAIPLWLGSTVVCATLTTGSPDRSLLLALPALATLAAFALPTLKRQVAALIDWFTLLFFSGCGFIIWVIWIAMQTGFPSQPAANVARLAPGFSASFSAIEFAIAMAATATWMWLVHWRVGRHRAAIWKSLVLPAGGAALCWLLLMTLWMPLLNYSQGYKVMVQRVKDVIQPAACVEVMGLDEGQIAALQWYGDLQFKRVQSAPTCPWLLAEPGPDMSQPAALDVSQWNLVVPVNHPTDGNSSILIFKRHN